MTSTDITDDATAQKFRDTLIRQMTDDGDLAPRWRPAFEQVPRHWFMPHLFLFTGGNRYTPLGSSTDRAQWLSHVYSNDMCVTQLNGDNTAWDTAIAQGSVHGLPTCSSTEPGLMAWMLDDLAVAAGHRVLEIGTGTGYNAAILCEHLGAASLTSIDVDAALVTEARTRLAALGYHPLLVAGDGRDGYPGNAPYDRIIATCSLPRVPAAWIEQLKPGGKMIVNVSGVLGGAMLVLRKNDAGNGAQGRFTKCWAGFLPARGAPAVADITPKDTENGCYDTGVTTLAPDVLSTPAFAFLAWLATQDARLCWADLDDGRTLTCLIGVDGSWCEVYPDDGGKRQVEQGGPRRLWNLTEQAHTFWTEHEHPDWSHFGVTMLGDDQRVWLDHPAQPLPWQLPRESHT
jgi:methyltransferase of ATP-grasp peptide maturase system